MKRLAVQKAELRARIALRRSQCRESVEQVLRPLAWLDRIRDFWRQVSPLAKLVFQPPGGATGIKSTHWSGVLFRWAPLVLGALRTIKLIRSKSPS